MALIIIYLYSERNLRLCAVCAQPSRSHCSDTIFVWTAKESATFPLFWHVSASKFNFDFEIVNTQMTPTRQQTNSIYIVFASNRIDFTPTYTYRFLQIYRKKITFNWFGRHLMCRFSIGSQHRRCRCRWHHSLIGSKRNVCVCLLCADNKENEIEANEQQLIINNNAPEIHLCNNQYIYSFIYLYTYTFAARYFVIVSNAWACTIYNRQAIFVRVAFDKNMKTDTSYVYKLHTMNNTIRYAIKTKTITIASTLFIAALCAVFCCLCRLSTGKSALLRRTIWIINSFNDKKQLKSLFCCSVSLVLFRHKFFSNVLSLYSHSHKKAK